eukprot:139022_1
MATQTYEPKYEVVPKISQCYECNRNARIYATSKTFELMMDGKIAHKLTVQYFVVCDHYQVEIYDHMNMDEEDSMLIKLKFHQQENRFEKTNVSGIAAILPIILTDVKQELKFMFYCQGTFLSPLNRIRLYIDDIDHEDGTHIAERLKPKTLNKCAVYLLFLIAAICASGIEYAFIDWIYATIPFAVSWIFIFVLSIFHCCPCKCFNTANTMETAIVNVDSSGEAFKTPYISLTEQDYDNYKIAAATHFSNVRINHY